MLDIFTTDKKADEITLHLAAEYIERHRTNELPRLQLLQDYYEGNHSISGRSKERGLSNNKLIINHAAYIADFATGYLLGEPVIYKAPEGADISPLVKMLKKADSATQDSDLALDLAVFGRAYDMAYMSSDEKPYPKLAKLSPLCSFVVYDDTVEQNPVFAVYYYPVYDNRGRIKQYKCSYQTAFVIVDFTLDERLKNPILTDEREHYFGAVPINEIYNNGQRRGDFEKVISLIDAYNLLQSDRVNDKEQFVNALLVLKGATLGDDNEEKTESYNALKLFNVLELPDGADAGYLIRQFDENSVEVLKNSIVSDIHKISGVPDMTDQSFAGNISGVAMKYKLLGLEQITRVKQRFFTEGLKYRLMLFSNVARVQGADISIADIEIDFRRSLPSNVLEIAQTVSQLSGLVPAKDLLAQLPFIADADKALSELEKEKAKSIKEQQKMFGNTPIVAGDEDEEAQ